MSDVELEIVDDGAVPADVHRLLAAAHAATGDRPLSDRLWLDLVQGGRPGAASILAWHARAVDGRALLGFCQLSRTASAWTMEVVVDPSGAMPVEGVREQLIEATLAHVAAVGGGTVHWWVFAASDESDAIARRTGLRPGRALHQMRVPLPLPRGLAESATAGLALRAFRVGEDEGAWLDVNNRAFAEHPEQGGWDLATLRQREREPWFDPEGFLLHHRDDRLAAFCWTKLHHDIDPVIGEIYVIAVDPDFFGLGLGRALAVAGLASIAARGVATGMLYVDRDNAAAFGLYRALGFAVHRTDRAYVGDIAPTTASTPPPEASS